MMNILGCDWHFMILDNFLILLNRSHFSTDVSHHWQQHVLTPLLLPPDTLESLERGEMVRDYNQNNTGTSPGSQSEDEEDPRTPTSVSSQGSQGYDSAGSDFVDIEGFSSNIGQDSSLNELNIQVSGQTQVFFWNPNSSTWVLGCRHLVVSTRSWETTV